MGDPWSISSVWFRPVPVMPIQIGVAAASLGGGGQRVGAGSPNVGTGAVGCAVTVTGCGAAGVEAVSAVGMLLSPPIDHTNTTAVTMAQAAAMVTQLRK